MVPIERIKALFEKSYDALYSNAWEDGRGTAP